MQTRICRTCHKLCWSWHTGWYCRRWKMADQEKGPGHGNTIHGRRTNSAQILLYGHVGCRHERARWGGWTLGSKTASIHFYGAFDWVSYDSAVADPATGFIATNEPHSLCDAFSSDEKWSLVGIPLIPFVCHASVCDRTCAVLYEISLYVPSAW